MRARPLRAAVLVPAPDYPEEHRWAYDVEAAALEAHGIAVEPRAWTELGDLASFDCVLPLVAWGYHLDPPRWHALLDRLEREAVPTLNPVPLLRWNSDKAYLAELDSMGVPTVHTFAVESLDEHALAEARRRFGCETLVVKPPVSASASGTHKIGPGDALPTDVAGKRILIQPFMASIAEQGEYSLLLFSGNFSHAIVKRPRPGEFRVQPHLGGTEVPCTPPDESIMLAQAALAAAPAESAYARVDMIADSDGALRIMELELIEPSLWLEHAPDNGESFVAAIREALG